VTRHARPLIPGLILGVALTLAAQQPAPPKLIPLTLDGYNKLIAAHKGRVVLATFWATYCIPCRAEIPELVKLAAQLRPRGLDLVVVSGDDPEQEAQARKFIAPKVPAGPLYIKSSDDDDKYAAGIHARWQGELPANFVYDRTGRKVGAFMGEVPTKDIQTAIEKFL
jgi:cytochrome c biogenesis protein CcmG/thiol:disulfide interchange protein DsbE